MTKSMAKKQRSKAAEDKIMNISAKISKTKMTKQHVAREKRRVNRKLKKKGIGNPTDGDRRAFQVRPSQICHQYGKKPIFLTK